MYHCKCAVDRMRWTNYLQSPSATVVQRSKLKKVSSHKFATSYENLVAALKILVTKLIEAV